MSATPEQRRAVHALIDAAINRGDSVRVAIFPRFVGDHAALLADLMAIEGGDHIIAYDNTEWSDEALYDSLSVALFSERTNLRQRPAAEGNPVGGEVRVTATSTPLDLAPAEAHATLQAITGCCPGKQTPHTVRLSDAGIE